MHHCKYFIGVHGAGLANMIFMKKGGSVMEFRKFDEGENYFYFSMASDMKLAYYYQFCNSPNEIASVQDADIFIDFAKLQENVQLMLQ